MIIFENLYLNSSKLSQKVILSTLVFGLHYSKKQPPYRSILGWSIREIGARVVCAYNNKDISKCVLIYFYWNKLKNYIIDKNISISEGLFWNISNSFSHLPQYLFPSIPISENDDQYRGLSIFSRALIAVYDRLSTNQKRGNHVIMCENVVMPYTLLKMLNKYAIVCTFNNKITMIKLK